MIGRKVEKREGEREEWGGERRGRKREGEWGVIRLFRMAC